MKEIVIISGKGGTGKTSIVSSFAALAENKVLADCDVDAADLHLILSPEIKEKEEFLAGKNAVIDRDICNSCGRCIEVCRFDAISDDYVIDPIDCEGCGVCAYFCPVEAIEMKEKTAGRLFISDTRYGPLFHAKLNIAEDNSGKLVTRVKEEAKKHAKEHGCELVLVDGPPGIGCPVISSVSGANVLLIVTEPTVSGIHDLKRVLELANHFRIKSSVCINKYDINKDVSDEIKAYCLKNNIDVAGEIPYDLDFTNAMIEGKSIVEYSDGDASDKVKKIWERVYNAVKD